MSERKRSPASSDDDEDKRESKRARQSKDNDRSNRDFESRRAEPAFREAHHPERVAIGLLERRKLALAALPGFATDIKTAVLPGPRLKTSFPKVDTSPH
jgi:hypothetical protein